VGKGEQSARSPEKAKRKAGYVSEGTLSRGFREKEGLKKKKRKGGTRQNRRLGWQLSHRKGGVGGVGGKRKKNSRRPVRAALWRKREKKKPGGKKGRYPGCFQLLSKREKKKGGG